MRLIDADECIEQIKKYCVGCNNYKGTRCRACSFDDAMGVVDSMPTIDDAEIRRQTIDECMYKLCNKCIQKPNKCIDLECPFAYDGCLIIKMLEPMKEETE